MTSRALADVLAAAGHTVRACAWCGGVFPADEDYQGRAHAPQRLYDTRTCKAHAAADRRTPGRTARRRHRARYGDLIARHELEAGGQLALDDTPLPAVPALEVPA